jgi:hypothetical protein
VRRILAGIIQYWWLVKVDITSSLKHSATLAVLFGIGLYPRPGGAPSPHVNNSAGRLPS